ncbi:MAG: hypothetical protein WCD13_20645, partial [Pseudolabrys sp.]
NTRRERFDCNAKCASRRFGFSQLTRSSRVFLIPKDTYFRESWKHLLENFDALWRQFRGVNGSSGDIPSRMRQTCY